MAHGPLFVVNPRSAGAETGRAWTSHLWPRVVSRFPTARCAMTSGPRDGARLAERAAADGVGLVVAVGGDGTVNEVVNGLMGETLEECGQRDAGQEPCREGGGPRRPVLGIVPRGTGCDFVKSLGIPKDLDRALDILARGRTVDADVCEMDLVSVQGRAVRRFSMNMCGCGASGEVARQVNETAWPRHGLLAFLLASLRAALAYRPRDVTIAVDGGAATVVRLLGLFVCNGQYCGGGMRPGRGARLDDGVLRVVEVGAIPPARALRQIYRLYTGKLEDVRGVRVYDARTVRVASAQTVLADCDGEQPGVVPVTYRVRPAALRLRVARDAPAV